MTALEKAIAESKAREANRTWEPRWREMVEVAKEAMQQSCICHETRVPCFVCEALAELERLAKEGLGG